MVDERALDLGFQELDRATANGEDELSAFRKGIEAYEAARPEPNPWRPLSEIDCAKPGRVLVDHDFLQAAINAYLKIDLAGGVIDEAMTAAIEAYEKVKWRPIEEAPRDGKEVLVQLGWPNESQTQTVVLYFSIGHWFDCQNNAQPPDWLANAMFRTIDPPPQDDVSRATSTPPAAEASS